MRRTHALTPLAASGLAVLLSAGLPTIGATPHSDFAAAVNLGEGQALSGWFTFRVEAEPADLVASVTVDVDEWGDGFRHVTSLDCCQDGLWTDTIHTDELVNGPDLLRFSVRYEWCDLYGCHYHVEEVPRHVHVDNPTWHDLGMVRFAEPVQLNPTLGEAPVRLTLSYGTNDRLAPEPVDVEARVDHAESGGGWGFLAVLGATIEPNGERTVSTVWEDPSRVGGWAVRGTIEPPAGFVESRGHGLDPDANNVKHGTAVFLTSAVCCRQVPIP